MNDYYDADYDREFRAELEDKNTNEILIEIAILLEMQISTLKCVIDTIDANGGGYR